MRIFSQNFNQTASLTFFTSSCQFGLLSPRMYGCMGILIRMLPAVTTFDTDCSETYAGIRHFITIQKVQAFDNP